MGQSTNWLAIAGGSPWPNAYFGGLRSPTVAPAALPFLFQTLSLSSHVSPDFRDPRPLFLESRELLAGEHQVGLQRRLA